ncbi:MAG: MMPL family transporter [Pseudonocardiaceae bacterium]
MTASLARFLVRRRVLVVSVAIVVLVLGGLFGSGVASSLTSGGFEDPHAESSVAAEVLERDFGRGDANLLLLVTTRAGVDDPAVTQAGLALTKELADEAGIIDVASYWSQQAAPLASTDRTQALILGRIVGDEDEVAQRVDQLITTYTRSNDQLDIAVGGSAAVAAQLRDTIEADHTRAQAIAFPVLLVLLLLVFGSVVAALLPLAVGAIAVIGTLAVLQLLTGVTDVSVYALNLATGLGLGLAIDYSLFMVSRFREELAAGRAIDEAVVQTVQTAGRTVAFSGVTVAISLSALLIFPQVFMRSFAYSGIAVVAVAVIGVFIVLPALLAILGHRVDAFRLRRRRVVPAGEGRWHRIAVAVMRRPIPIATGVLAVLLLLGAPFLNVEFGGIDSRVLPAGSQAHLVGEEVRENFAARESAPVTVVVPDSGDSAADTASIAQYAGELSTVPGVARVDALTGSYISGQRIAANPAAANQADADGTWLSVIPAVEPISPAAKTLVADLRAVDAPFDGVLIGGPSATFVDSQQSLFRLLPVAIGIIAAVTFVLLFLMFGSLLVPTTAIVLTLLSLTATFGAMVWVFQDGHLSGLLGFTATGTLDTSIPILMFCLAFGVSMDYEVFLLSRIKEEYDRTGDNTTAVAMGLARTGGIVTAAAALLATVLIVFATSGVILIKLFGIGLALAVIVDATLIRLCLVPAAMKLAGPANWWLPRPLRRIHPRFISSEAHHKGIAEGTRDFAPRHPALIPGSSESRLEQRGENGGIKNASPADQPSGAREPPHDNTSAHRQK